MKRTAETVSSAKQGRMQGPRLLRNVARQSFAVMLAAVAAGLSAPAAAQILGGGGLTLPTPALPGGGGWPPRGLPDAVLRSELPSPEAQAPRLPATPGIEPLAAAGEAIGVLASAPRRLAADRLLRLHPDAVEADDQGEPVVRGEVLALGATPQSLARARQAGFRVSSRATMPELDIEVHVLKTPPGVPATEAVRRLRVLDPSGQYEFNHLYQEGGVVGAALAHGAAESAGGGGGRGLRIGLIDGSAAARQPTLAGARLVQKAFAPGGPRVTPHATAVASLLVGDKGRFRGAAPGATLYVADVYGPTPAGGSAEAIARALGWLASAGIPVINISLVGPPNALLGAAIGALTAKGHVVVTATGNDGPAAAPLYPAAYPGVVAVTAVNARRRALPEAGRGPHVDFAAPGSEMAAAGVGEGFVAVRGTSFASPLAAGRLAQLLSSPDRAAAARAVKALAREAEDLGAPGRDPIYGAGLVGFELRTDPASVDVRGAALRE